MSFVIPTGQRVGFWTGSDKVWGGMWPFVTPPTPQQFFDFYFNDALQPAAILWTTGLSPSGPFPITPAQESAWLNQLAAICDRYTNIVMNMLIFVNVSGVSIAVVSIDKTHGLVLKRNKTLTNYTVAPSILMPFTNYNFVLQDYTRTLFAPIASFTTDATGAAVGSFTIPDVSTARPDQINASAGWFISVVTLTGASTPVFEQLALQGDQTVDLTNYLNTVRGHRSIYGIQFEDEYFGNDPTIVGKFFSIVTAAGYINLGPSTVAGVGPNLYYSSYPYFGGGIPFVLTNAIGINYGETGTPVPPDPAPIWTQAVVNNIVSNTPSAAPNNCPVILFNCDLDTNNPAGNMDLWASPVLRGWIAANPKYQASFLKATAASSTSTTLTLTPRRTA